MTVFFYKVDVGPSHSRLETWKASASYHCNTSVLLRQPTIFRCVMSPPAHHLLLIWLRKACKKYGVKRVVVVTSIGAGDSESQAPFMFKILMNTVCHLAVCATESYKTAG